MSYLLLLLLVLSYCDGQDVISHTIRENRKFEVQLYLPAAILNSNHSFPLHLFAVGTSFSATDYKEFGETLARNGVIAAIYDYQLSGMVQKR